MTEGGDESAEHRRRAVALLEANHEFPCAFSVSVIARNEGAVEAAVLAAATAAGAPVTAHERKPSGGGKYVSHRLTIPCATADEVLELFARVRAVEGVITVL